MKTGSLTNWLKSQAGRDDPVGDLARDVSSDPCWSETGDRSALKDHLDGHGACDAARRALRRAFREYKKTVIDGSQPSHDDRITIKLPRCTLVLTESELLQMLRDHIGIWQRALQRGKWLRRHQATERRRPCVNTER